MIEIIIQDKKGKEEEVIKMPQDAWNRILKLIKDNKPKLCPTCGKEK